MNCANHPDIAAVAFCRTCGKPLCDACKRPAQGTIYCEQHVPITASPTQPPPVTDAPPSAFQQTPITTPTSPYVSPYTAPGPIGDVSVSPGLAFLLGLIPGVGAIYNGQYAKGLAHVAIFGLLISIVNTGNAPGFEPLFGILIAGFYFYMPFEAYHTARRRQLGQPVDEFSSLLPGSGTATSGFPIGPILLIVIGVLFLLNSLDLIRFYQLVRWWPLALIILGVYLLFVRLIAARTAPRNAAEYIDER